MAYADTRLRAAHNSNSTSPRSQCPRVDKANENLACRESCPICRPRVYASGTLLPLPYRPGPIAQSSQRIQPRPKNPHPLHLPAPRELYLETYATLPLSRPCGQAANDNYYIYSSAPRTWLQWSGQIPGTFFPSSFFSSLRPFSTLQATSYSLRTRRRRSTSLISRNHGKTGFEVAGEGGHQQGCWDL